MYFKCCTKFIMELSVYLILKHGMGVMFILLSGLISQNISDAKDLPCEFQDSINITDGYNQSNSIIFQNMTFQPNHYAEINYIEDNEKKHEITMTYIRGCPCLIKHCLRLCCPYGHFHTKDKISLNESKPCKNDDKAKDLIYNVLMNNGQNQTVKLQEHFYFVDQTKKGSKYEKAVFLIKENGDVMYKGYKQDGNYCLSVKLDKILQQPKFDVILYYNNSSVQNVNTGEDRMYATAMIISVPFLLVTFLVYLFVPQLRNMHGKCLICNFGSLMVGYIILAWIKLQGWKADEDLCIPMGRITYFALLSAFFWTNVISYDLHLNFRQRNILNAISKKKRFLNYMCYAWGIPFILTMITVILDNTKPFKDEWLPEIGSKTCFIKNPLDEKLSAFLYFYLWIYITATTNIVFFVLTALIIRQAQRDISRITSQSESARHQSHLNNQMDNWMLFMRIFLIMGISWTMEALFFPFLNNENKDAFIIKIIDIFNLFQGFFIFILFILKRRILLLVKDRFSELRRGDTISRASLFVSSFTRTTNVELQQRDI